MGLLIYYKFFALFVFLSFSGILIVRSATKTQRAELIIPSGIIFGIAFYIFLLNSVAHFLKGPPGFWLSLAIEMIFSYLVYRKFRPKPMIVSCPKNFLFWFLPFIVWYFFLYLIASHARSNGGDTIVWYPLSNLFSRGDYPMHAVIQPEYIQLYHTGEALLLGAVKAITGAPLYFIHNVVSFIMLVSWSQILTWLLISPERLKGYKALFAISIPAIIGIISLGGWMIAIPNKIVLPDTGGNIIAWVGNLPRLLGSYTLASPGDLDNMIYYFHRLLGISFSLASLTAFLYPSKNRFVLSSFLFVILSATALADESIFIILFASIAIISFFTIMKDSRKLWFLLFSLATITAVFQGGYITETILNRYGSGLKGQFFPVGGGAEPDYRATRLKEQAPVAYPDSPKYGPFKWIFPGGLAQVILLFAVAIGFSIYTKNKKSLIKYTQLFWFLSISSIVALVAYHGIVPTGWYQVSGQRFLAVAILLSGIGIAYFIEYVWGKLKNESGIIIKILLSGIIITTVFPPLAYFFPRPKVYWFLIQKPLMDKYYQWIEKNFEYRERFLIMLGEYADLEPVPSMDLVKNVGIYTPLWPFGERVYDDYAASPEYIDIYSTLNPSTMGKLGITYIMIDSNFVSKLPKERIKDLRNPNFFQFMYISPHSTLEKFNAQILRVDPSYFINGKDIDGSLKQLKEKSPDGATYYIDNIKNLYNLQIYRAILFLFREKNMSFDVEHTSFYPGRYDFEWKTSDYLPRDKNVNYDYYLLGKSTDPKALCNCNPKLVWESKIYQMNLWQNLDLFQKGN